KKEIKNIPWREIAGSRDKIVHDYFMIDLDTIWQIIREDIPILKKAISEKFPEIQRQSKLFNNAQP
ncbi:MAG: hypothetical protein CEN88_316, partial [Candidatus Berkelbacteria bacterium Licking1014_2]